MSIYLEKEFWNHKTGYEKVLCNILGKMCCGARGNRIDSVDILLHKGEYKIIEKITQKCSEEEYFSIHCMKIIPV